MKVKLSLKERLAISNLFPARGSLTEQIVARAIANKTDLTSDEIDKWQIINEGDRLRHNDKVEEVEYEFNKTEIQLLKDGYERLDKDKMVTPFNLDICLKVRDLK